jgi:hypothetical protein
MLQTENKKTFKSMANRLKKKKNAIYPRGAIPKT